MSFGHKAFILSLSKLIIESNTKVVDYGMLFKKNVSQKAKVKLPSVNKDVILSKAYLRHF